MNFCFFSHRHRRQSFVQYSHQYRPVFAHRKGKLEPVTGCSGDLQIGQPEFLDAIGDRRQVANEGIHLSPGNRLERLLDTVGEKKTTARIGPFHQVLGDIAFDDRHPVPAEIQHAIDEAFIGPGDDNHGKIQIRSGKKQKTFPFRTAGDTRQNIDPAESGFVHHLGPTEVFDRGHLYLQLFV